MRQSYILKGVTGKMIMRDNYTEEHIANLRKETGADHTGHPTLLLLR